jgi:hypothetical protein
MKRIVLAALASGVAMFIWTSVAHTALPLARIGIRELPNESTVLAPLQASAGSQDGLYLYPGMGVAPGASLKEWNAAMPAYERKLASGPSGLLIYHPPGRPSMTTSQLVTGFLTELIEVLLACVLLSVATLKSYTSRAAFVVVIGVIASMPTNVSYWNWYGFPGNYTAAYMFIQIVGFAIVGLIAGAIVKPAAGIRVASAT